MRKNEISGGIVLAGGAGSRIGGSKPLVQLNGTPLITIAIDSLSRVTNRVIAVAATREQIGLPDVIVIEDLWSGYGPVGGIVTGLLALGPGSYLVLACDMPFVQLSVLELLIENATKHPEAHAVVPVISGMPEPLCAIYRHSAAAVLQTFMEEGGRSARKALKQLSYHSAPEDQLRKVDPELVSFRNINTLEDLTKFVAAE